MGHSLKDVRAALEHEREDLAKRASKVASNLRRERTPLGSDSEDAASVLQNDEVLDALDAEGRDRLARIDAALQRIDDGSYGVCADCGEAIAPARLEAAPESFRCLDCAERRDDS